MLTAQSGTNVCFGGGEVQERSEEEEEKVEVKEVEEKEERRRRGCQAHWELLMQ